ncbi:MAG: hypothetical protein Q8R24_05945 [Legionellaceae bacterium]|nr:hypothetical protein [Legionellaceae bacterium]
MTKLYVFFAGTGQDGKTFQKDREDDDIFNEDVIRVYIKGCQEKNVGGGYLLPDLNIAADHLYQSFTNKILDTKNLQNQFGSGILAICVDPRSEDGRYEIDTIALEGYSRGAVSTFVAAKKLNNLNIPIHIVAHQPVPGWINPSQEKLASYGDLSQCSNIASATTLLGSSNRERGFLYNNFYKQMIAKFNSETKVKNYTLPVQSHHIDPTNGVNVQDLYAKDALTSHKFVKESPVSKHTGTYATQIQSWYTSNLADYCFTPTHLKQEIYTIGNDAPASSPYYSRYLTDEATRVLSGVENVEIKNLTTEQTSAIIAISQLSLQDGVLEKSLYPLVLKNSQEGKAFVDLVNEVASHCNYLAFVTKDDRSSEKSQCIDNSQREYQRSVFIAAHDYLDASSKTNESTSTFNSTWKDAESKFINSALGIQRGLVGRVLQHLSNFITKCIQRFCASEKAPSTSVSRPLLPENRSMKTMREIREKHCSVLKNIQDTNKKEDPTLDENLSTTRPKN